jgi:hypothetical protein
MQYIPNKTEKNLKALANLAKIPLKHGWKNELELILGLEKGAIPRWIYRDNISAKGLLKIEKKGYPLSSWCIHATDETHTDVHESVTIYKLVNEKELCRDIRTILKKGDTSTIQALSMNVKEFLNKVIEKEQCLGEINRLHNEMTSLHKKVDNLLKVDKIKKKVVD